MSDFYIQIDYLTRSTTIYGTEVTYHVEKRKMNVETKIFIYL